MFSITSKKHFQSSKFDYDNLPWWNRRTSLERILCFIIVTIVLTLLVTLASLGLFGYNYQKHTEAVQGYFASSSARRFAREVESEIVCDTPGCAQAANDIIQNLDETVDPCDNFYKFACGGFVAKRQMREDKSQVSVFDDVQDELNSQIKGLMQRQLDATESRTTKLVKDMYDSCMNEESIEKASSQPLQNVLTTLGGWPVVLGDQWSESNFDWMDTLFKFRSLGYSHSILITMTVSIDFKDNTVNTVELDQTSFGLPDREYLMDGLNDSATKAYFDLMVKGAKKLGANADTAEQELLQAFNFERALANFSLPKEERRDFNSMYHKYTITQLQELVPQIDWLKYLTGLLPGETITKSDTVIVDVPEFLKKFGELITNTDKRIIANYMMWRVVKNSMSYLSKDWKAIEHEYNSAVSGEDKELPRWEQCVDSISQKLGIALSSYYIKHYFKGDSKQKAEEMIKYISKEFLNILNDIDWMGEETKKQAREKAETITPYIGYPQELLNDTIVDEHHQKLTISSDKYFNNIYHIKKWSVDYEFSKLRRPNVKGVWQDHSDIAIVNAFYNPLENSIELPAGILQKVFFGKDRPTYLNFGGIGYVIGHEITHGFDDMGKQFDKVGNNKNWWDEATDEHFKEKANCIIYQYGNYTAENGMKVNGINTQGENIADNGGLKEAFRAYHSWVKDHSPEGKLPGLKYSPSQLFWLSAANVWCGKLRPEYLKLIITADSHSPPEFRVNGPMSNLQEFSTAFKCPLGSNMNPEKKCQVW